MDFGIRSHDAEAPVGPDSWVEGAEKGLLGGREELPQKMANEERRHYVMRNGAV